MKSRILIDLDESNQPVITINYTPSDDLKDRLVKQFIENFGYESNTAKVTFESSTLQVINSGISYDKIITIKPSRKD